MEQHPKTSKDKPVPINMKEEVKQHIDDDVKLGVIR